MRVVERLRAVPRRWYVVGGAALALLTTAVLAAPGGDGALTTRADPTSTTDSATTIPATRTTPPPDTRSGTSTSLPWRPPAPSTTTTSVDETQAPPDIDLDDPAVVARPIPPEPTGPPPTTIAPPPWAASTRTAASGHVAADVGCASDLSAEPLDWFFSSRVGPVIGWDYQHVYPLGGDRYLWLFQDVFLDHTGTVGRLDRARFVHNAALLQTGRCFTLLHGGSPATPAPFEVGDGTARALSKWYWPMGGELSGDTLWVFWAEMVKDPYDPAPPDGLGWHPERVHLAGYDRQTLRRTYFQPAPDSSATPIYGYAVSSDGTHTYLFGNTFEQNLVREGGFWNGPHSATAMWLARVPNGRLTDRPEYRTADGWSPNRADAVPIVNRYYTENPMQPRYLDGQWVSATAVDGYWGDALAIDMATQPWGPWTTVHHGPLSPRNGDRLMNTYHAHLLPWRDGYGSLLVTVSNNARNMQRDAWPRPDRYRPMVIYSPYQATPAPPPPVTIPPTDAPTTPPPSPTPTPATVPPTTLPPTTSTTTTTTTTTTSSTSTTVAASSTSTSVTTTSGAP